MKKYILSIIVLCLLILFITACSKVDAIQNDRFEIIYKQSFFKTFKDIYILQDKTTGIKYIYISNGGITRLEE
jgi:uncharacterized alpha/beta hydrolase family protein